MATDIAFSKIPVSAIITGPNKLMSRQTFYTEVKAGRVQLYKFRGRSYVDRAQFDKAFTPVNITPNAA